MKCFRRGFVTHAGLQNKVHYSQSKELQLEFCSRYINIIYQEILLKILPQKAPLALETVP